MLAFAGRLTAQKDLGRALDAMRELTDARLLIAGDGPERAALEAAAGDRVEFLGPLPRAQVLGLLHAADASILTSAWENFPHGVVESLAVGTPVIATRTGGVAEVVHDGENGLLVEPGDTAAFTAAVRRYLDDPELRERLRAAAVLGRRVRRRTRSTESSRRSWRRRRDEARALRRARTATACRSRRACS